MQQYIVSLWNTTVNIWNTTNSIENTTVDIENTTVNEWKLQQLFKNKNNP